MLKNYGLYITITKNVDHLARTLKTQQQKKKKNQTIQLENGQKR